MIGAFSSNTIHQRFSAPIKESLENLWWIWYDREKRTRRATTMAQSLRGESGKSDYQRLRAYLVMQFFLKNADERHPVSMQDILLYLNEDCGISADRRAIYKDIDTINMILYMLDNAEDGCTLKEAIETLEKYPEEALITSGGKNGKYYMPRRPQGIEVDDVRLLA